MNQDTFVNHRCDWDYRGTKEEIEFQFSPFEFKGCGWYFTKGIKISGESYEDSLLILPYLDTIPKDDSTPETRYICLVWNHHQAAHALGEMCAAPVLVDER